MSGFQLLLFCVAVALMVIGFIGMVVPVLPGPLLMFGGMWLIAAIGHYQRIGVATLVVLAALTAVSSVLDAVSGLLGARRFGASRAGLLGAVLGGLFLLPCGPLGVLFGPLIGAFIGEMLARRRFSDAARAGFGAWIGQLVGVLIKLALAGAMIALFLASYFWY